MKPSWIDVLETHDRREGVCASAEIPGLARHSEAVCSVCTGVVRGLLDFTIKALIYHAAPIEVRPPQVSLSDPDKKKTHQLPTGRLSFLSTTTWAAEQFEAEGFLDESSITSLCVQAGFKITAAKSTDAHGHKKTHMQTHRHTQTHTDRNKHTDKLMSNRAAITSIPQLWLIGWNVWNQMDFDILLKVLYAISIFLHVHIIRHVTSAELWARIDSLSNTHIHTHTHQNKLVCIPGTHRPTPLSCCTQDKLRKVTVATWQHISAYHQPALSQHAAPPHMPTLKCVWDGGGGGGRQRSDRGAGLTLGRDDGLSTQDCVLMLTHTMHTHTHCTTGEWRTPHS